MEEMRSIRREVADEYEGMSELLSGTFLNLDAGDKEERIRRKLLFLFVKDLLAGLNGKILNDKGKRDGDDVPKVSLLTKGLSWCFVVGLNLGALFYVYLFAVQQNEQRQSAVSEET
jgi:hypothetical protein